MPWSSFWRSVVEVVTRMFRRTPSAPELPVPRLPAGERDPEPGTRAFLRHPKDDLAVNDPRNDAWIAHLRAELPFPQPLYGAVDPPVTAREVHERMSALDAEIAEQVARAAERDGAPGEFDPDWFLTLSDRFLPLAAWYAGVGLPSGANELPDRLRDLTDRARRIPGINRALEWLAEQVQQLTRQNAGYQAAWFTLLKVHLEAMLRPLASGPGGVEVSFDFPPPGARVADLAPPPAPGGPTSGLVARVLCPALTVRLRSDARDVTLQRGAHVRGR